jgi:autotransporter-associated beta strand protein
LKLSGNGQLVLSNGGNTYGALGISNGRVFINTSAAALPAAATVTITGGILDFGTGASYGNSITVGSGGGIATRRSGGTSLTGTVTLPGSGTVIFNNDDSSTYGLSIASGQTLTNNLTVQLSGNRMTTNTALLGGVTLAGALTGNGGLTLVSSGNVGNTNGLYGSGVLTLTGTNTYIGATTVSNGTLRLGAGGSIGNSTNLIVGTVPGVAAILDANAAGLTIGAGQTLLGYGTVTGLVTNDGTLAPGGSIGTLTIGGNLVLNATSTNIFEVDGSTPTNDVVALGGTVTYGGVLQVVPTGSFTNGQTFILFSGAGATDLSNFGSIVVNPPMSGTNFTFTNGVLTAVVVPTGPSGPATLTNSVSGGVLSLSWPGGQGWRLQMQTNSLTVGLYTNWVEAAGSSMNSTNITIDSTQPTVFYRLVYP